MDWGIVSINGIRIRWFLVAKKTIEQMHEYARTVGGECLSETGKAHCNGDA